MALTKEQMQEVVKDFGRDGQDTGSSEVQIAALTGKIKVLTEHMKSNHKDYSSRLGLLKMVAQRRTLLNYLHKENEQKYNEIKHKLGLK
ncbi:MAG: 30S ribosomal protein S15 [Candidatus Dependentiae bacterium]